MKSLANHTFLPAQSPAQIFNNNSHKVHAPLTVTPFSVYEHEANTVANRVQNGQPTFVQSKVQPTTVTGPDIADVHHQAAAGNQLENEILSLQGKGQNLDASTASFMSSRMGAGFTDVNIHTGSNAASLSKRLNAQAFTVGSDIFFNDGKFAPSTQQGRHLLAHELTHTIQQGGQSVAIQKQDEKDKTFTPKPEVDFKLLPPEIQVRLYHFLLEADTSKVHIDFTTKSFMAGLSYSYGDALSLKLKFTDFTSKLGWTPGENAFSLGFSQGPLSAGLSAKPWESKYGFTLSYGAPLLPAYGDMSKTFMAGGNSAGNMLTGLPGITNDPLAWYRQYKPDIENVSKSADLVKKITGDGKSTIRFGASFTLSYDPESKLVFTGKAGILF